MSGGVVDLANAGYVTQGEGDNEELIVTAPKWDCKDGTPDEDHDWRRVSDWYGDPGVINGTADCSFRRCRVCGKEAELDDVNDFYEEDYR